MQINEGSFRDPAGQVFSHDGDIYRSIFAPGVKDFEAARDAGIYRQLIEHGMLVPYEEVSPGDWAPEGTVYCLRHPRLPMISYPWEWSFSMLQDAALLHLDVMELLLPQGFWLRDASALNVQYDGERLRLIDTLSIGQRAPKSPWVAYGQFCAHFLAPLVMAAYRDIRTLGLWRQYLDGMPLDLAVNLLPAWRRYQPGLFMHLTLHAYLQDRADRKEDVGHGGAAKTPTISDVGLLGIIRSLRRTIKGIRWQRVSKIWQDYQNLRTYQEEDVAAKSAYVAKVVTTLRPAMVWDFGANRGEFSAIAASQGAFVASIEGDPACTEYMYQTVTRAPEPHRVLPLTMDLANPSPGLGWDGRERLSLTERGPADLLLALALIHHLVLSSYAPLAMIAEWFSRLSPQVLVEFVPPTDPMVRKLLSHRGDEHLPYNIDVFQASFGKYFVFADQLTLRNGRTLYLCQCR